MMLEGEFYFALLSKKSENVRLVLNGGHLESGLGLPLAEGFKGGLAEASQHTGPTF